MPTPNPRTPVRPGRGTKANLDTALAASAIKEGELVYAKDQDKLYIVEGGAFIAAGGSSVGNTAPSGPTATGTAGEIRQDGDYIYICTATNTWKRVAISTWSNGDPLFSSVALLLHADGTNGSTTFTDSSSLNLSLTPTSATLSTAQQKFGSASINFNSGSSGSLQLSSASNALDIGASENFTTEFFIYVTGHATPGVVADSTYAILEFSGSIDYTLNLVSSTNGGGTCKLVMVLNYSTVVIDHQSSVPLNQWVHVAMVRSGDVNALYIDGVKSTTTWSNGSALDNSSFWSIGPRQSGTTNRFYLDEVRVTKSNARYTANFTPPTAAFPNNP